MNDLVAVCAVVPAVLVLALVLATAGQWNRRRELVRRWAAGHGWAYADHDDAYASLQSGHPFGGTEDRRTSEVLIGEHRGVPAVSFRMVWATDGPGGRRSHEVHVVALRLPAALPTVEVVPLGSDDGRPTGAGAPPTGSIGHEALAGAFRVVADHEPTARAVLHPGTVARLLEPDARLLPWRAEGLWLACWLPGGTDLAAIRPRLELLAAVADGVPRAVWLDHGHDPDQPVRPQEPRGSAEAVPLGLPVP